MPDYAIENNIGKIVIGIDEVGRGALAGPVVTCAAWLNPENIDQGILGKINDSKLIPKKHREKLSLALTGLPIECLQYSIGVASVNEIDEINILNATLLAMRRAYDGMHINADAVLVDGNRLPDIPCKALAVVGGDRLSLSIAAASIIAKVYRDSLMNDLSASFPKYGWNRNAGYGTKEHKDAIHTFGLSVHHRRSFHIK